MSSCSGVLLNQISRRSSRAGSPGAPNHTSSKARARSGREATAAGSGAAIADRVLAQEIEIAAAIGLQDLAAVEPGIAALRDRGWRGLAARQFLGRDQEVDAALLDRQANTVAVPDLGQRPPRSPVRRHLQHAR